MSHCKRVKILVNFDKQIFDLLSTFSDEPARMFALCCMPLLAALIGWLTNYIAVKMIFRPRRPVRLFFFTFWGLLPRRQEELAESIGETVARELISSEDVFARLQQDEVVDEVSVAIREQVEKFISEKLASNPLLGAFLQGDMLKSISAMLDDHIRETSPALISRMLDKAAPNLNFKDLVSQKVSAFSLDKLEDIVYRIAAKELRAIVVLGAVLGFLVGLAQLAVLVFFWG